ncbi:GSCFA domain-containing protein [Chitinophaga pendula]|uniref:GSCFA domain-containing protein n=1 Tax=Chitinophaga TaxID=79328 RepID=UPI000BB08FEE|nr:MULTISPECIES: GSCFA domain-containing protein [Chitinophaga]ASZ13753.1 GSCFA domain-containing protein [Chitinophaga sp. MD30]UCJ08628.1 GSCFA domain-containing protein [Chitinophaga pendula]
MQFRLTFPVTPPDAAIRYEDPLLLMGSCFTEEIGRLLQAHQFNTQLNPHGILYNPVSITQALHAYLDGKVYTEADLFEQDGLWHSWDHHSRFSSPDAAQALASINAAQAAACERIDQLEWVVITLGSAFAYQLRDNGKLVGNCHKVPAGAFYKKLLTPDEVISALDNAIHRLWFRNRRVKILFTISPVRYVRDGVVENNMSKAVLIQAVHHMVNKFDHLYYFPAYELVLDDLRDYRFFKDDLVHPNDTAIQYVWEQFTRHFLTPESQELLGRIAEINRARQHRPFHAESAAHRKFLQRYAVTAKALQQQYPYLSLAEDIRYFEQGS